MSNVVLFSALAAVGVLIATIALALPKLSASTDRSKRWRIDQTSAAASMAG